MDNMELRNFTVFPDKYAKDERERAQKEISQINANRSKEKDGGIFVSIGCFGAIAVFFICCGTMWSNLSADGGFFWALIVTGFYGFLAYCGICLILFGIDHLSVKSDSNHRDTLNREIRQNTEEKINSYYEQFEEKARLKSVKFADSKLAMDVIDWISNQYYSLIKNTGRSSHIEKVIVSLLIDVYTDKIVLHDNENGGYKTYDFELMRCKNLNSCLEQAALAITIATKVQLNVRMKYSHDISGTVSNIDIKYNYFDQYAQASIIYTALNGSFEPVKEW